MANKKKEEDEVDPLDLGDDDMEIDYGKMDNLREMLAKSSVAITFKVTLLTALIAFYHLLYFFFCRRWFTFHIKLG